MKQFLRWQQERLIMIRMYAVTIISVMTESTVMITVRIIICKGN